MPCASSLARRVRVGLEEADRRHDEPGHAEGALEALLVDDRLLHRMQRAVGGGQPFDRDDVPVAHGVRQHRARIVRHIVDEHRAGAALGAVAAKLGAGEPQLVAQRHGERFLLHHVDASRLAVDVQRDQPLDRRRLATSGRGWSRCRGTGTRPEATAPPAITPLMKLRREIWSRMARTLAQAAGSGQCSGRSSG